MPLSGVCFLSLITNYFSGHQQFASTLIRDEALDLLTEGSERLEVAVFIIHARNCFIYLCRCRNFAKKKKKQHNLRNLTWVFVVGAWYFLL